MKSISYSLATLLCLLNSCNIFSSIQTSGSGLSIVGPATITQPGHYRVSTDIDGTITIAASKVELNLSGHCISGNTNCIEVSNQSDIIIRDGNVENANSNGIFVQSCTNVNIINVSFSGNGIGMLMTTVTCFTVFECSFVENTVRGLDLVTSQDGIVIDSKFIKNVNEGIRLNNSNNIKISRNISSFGQIRGIQLFLNCLNNTIEENECNQNDFGIELFLNSINNTIVRNSIYNTFGDGIILNSSSNNLILQNRIIGTGFGAGITVANNSHNITIKKNTCLNGEFGMSIGETENSVVMENECINANNTGITLNQVANCIIAQNECLGCTTGIELNRVNNSQFLKNTAGGNSNNGIQLNGTGGDLTQFNIFKENNVTNNTNRGLEFQNNVRNNCFIENFIMQNGVFGIDEIGGGGVSNNSFFSNKAQQNGPTGTDNFGPLVPASMIITFDMNITDFINTNTRPGINVEVIP